MDFVVSQWVSGREGEDCQEIELEEGIEIIVDPELSKSSGVGVGKAKL